MNGSINRSVFPVCGVHWLIATRMIVVFIFGFCFWLFFFVLAMLSDIIRTWFWFISLTYLVLHKHFHGHFFHNVYFRPSLSADWTESTMLYIRPKMRAYRWRPLESLSLYPAYSWCFRCSIWDICSNTLPCKPEE